MVNISYDKNLDIFYEQFIGSLTIEDLVAHHISFGKRKDLPKKYKLLIDYTQAKFKFEIDELDKLVAVLKQFILNFDYVKMAILHSKPLEQAINMIFNDMVKNTPNFYTEIFSTKEAAIKWLLFYDIENVNKREFIKKEGEGGSYEGSFNKPRRFH